MATIAGNFSRRIKAAERRRRAAANSWAADNAFMAECDLMDAAVAAAGGKSRIDGAKVGLGFAGGAWARAVGPGFAGGDWARPMDCWWFWDGSALAVADDGLDVSAVNVVRGGMAAVSAAGAVLH